MSFFARHKKLTPFLCIAGVLALLVSPVFTLALFSPTKFGEQPACKENEAIPAYARASLKEIIFDPDIWQDTSVWVRGKISFAPLQGTFYLRDGIWSLPIDASGCENMEIFNGEAARVSMFGTILLQNGEPTLVIDDFFETVPPATRMVFNAGVYGLIGLFVWPIGRFLERRRRHKGGNPEFEEAKKKQAFGPLFFGILGALAWFGNPIIGACACIYGLIAGKKFLRSSYRRRALIGMIVCTVVLAGLGLATASGNLTPHYGQDFFTAFEESMGPGV